MNTGWPGRMQPSRTIKRNCGGVGGTYRLTNLKHWIRIGSVDERLEKRIFLLERRLERIEEEGRY